MKRQCGEFKDEVQFMNKAENAINTRKNQLTSLPAFVELLPFIDAPLHYQLGFYMHHQTTENNTYKRETKKKASNSSILPAHASVLSKVLVR